MDHAARIDAVERDLGLLVAALRAGPADARVPTCPDFEVGDLAGHVGEFCGFWAHVLAEATGRPKPPFPDLPEPAARPGWVEGIGTDLLAQLRPTSSDTPSWTWYDHDRSAGFVARRVAHEMAVHRVDAQLARGPAGPVDTELAVDGIEEIFVLVDALGAEGNTGVHGSGETLHLHGTDHDAAEWLVRLDPDGMTVTREHAKGDLALRGPVSDLEMLLYQRPTVGEVERFGDESVLGTFHREFTFA